MILPFSLFFLSSSTWSRVARQGEQPDNATPPVADPAGCVFMARFISRFERNTYNLSIPCPTGQMFSGTTVTFSAVSRHPCSTKCTQLAISLSSKNKYSAKFILPVIKRRWDHHQRDVRVKSPVWLSSKNPRKPGLDLDEIRHCDQRNRRLWITNWRRSSSHFHPLRRCPWRPEHLHLVTM